LAEEFTGWQFSLSSGPAGWLVPVN